MLTDLLNLRTTSQWVGFSEEQIIPIIYGLVEIKPLAYDTRGMVFVIADHPCSYVKQVIVNDFLVTTWQLFNSVDNTGHPVAFLKFNKPVSGEIRVTVMGKNLFNAKDIIADFSNENYKSLSLLGFNTRNYELAGVLRERITKRAAIDTISKSLSFCWNSTAYAFGYLFPTYPSAIKTISLYEASGQSSIIELYNKLIFRYDYNYFRNEYSRAITLINRDSVKLYGLREFTYDSQWVKKSGDAYDIGSRLLTFYSQPVWEIDTSVPIIENIKEGDWVSFNHAFIPINKAFCLSSVNDGFELKLKLQGVLFDTQNIVLLNSASLFEKDVKKIINSEGKESVIGGNSGGNALSAGLSIDGGLAVLTVLDESGNAISGATVRIDGGSVKTTGGAGEASFPVGTTGSQYTILIESTHYYPLEIQGVW